MVIAGQNDVLDALLPQKHIEICSVKGPLARFVDDRLAWQWCQFRDDFPTRLSPGENASARPGIADACANSATAPAFVLGQIRKVGAMAFARMQDMKFALTEGGQKHLERLDGCAR